MKLFGYYDRRFLPIYGNFLVSLEDNFELHMEEIGVIPVEFTFSPEKYWVLKPQFVQRCIVNNLGEIILISDVDIQFFGKVYDIVRDLSAKKEMVFLRPGKKYRTHEPWPVNIGFFSIHCTPETLAFWMQVERLVTEHKTQDEVVVNRLLPLVSFEWGFWPESFWCFDESDVPDDILLHHATNACGEQEKLEQLRRMRSRWLDRLYNRA